MFPEKRHFFYSKEAHKPQWKRCRLGQVAFCSVFQITAYISRPMCTQFEAPENCVNLQTGCMSVQGGVHISGNDMPVKGFVQTDRRFAFLNEESNLPGTSGLVSSSGAGSGGLAYKCPERQISTILPTWQTHEFYTRLKIKPVQNLLGSKCCKSTWNFQISTWEGTPLYCIIYESQNIHHAATSRRTSTKVSLGLEEAALD